MNDYLTIKLKELLWVKTHNKPTLVKVIKESLKMFNGTQFKMF